MAFNHTALYNISFEDERYLNQQLSPQSCLMDLFSVHPADMDPSGICIAEDIVSLSSAQDLDSDNQSWSMSSCPSIDMAITSPISTATSTCASANSLANTNTNSSTSPSTSSTHLSYSPEIKPKEYISTRTDKRRKIRSLSIESSTSSARTQASTSTQVSSLRDPQGRNAAKRAAHNIIEKRYRTNMNAKFLALEKAIFPAGVQESSPGSAGTGVESLKKSEILSNALTYIEHIKQENLAVQEELALLKQGLV